MANGIHCNSPDNIHKTMFNEDGAAAVLTHIHGHLLCGNYDYIVARKQITPQFVLLLYDFSLTPFLKTGQFVMRNYVKEESSNQLREGEKSEENS